MRKNPYYRLKYIAGVPYLLTFGQGNADFRHDLRLNDTSVFLWEQLGSVSDAEELVARCAKHFQISEEQYAFMEASIREFIHTLYRKGILLPKKETARNIALYKTLEIAGLFFRLYGRECFFSEEFLSFETDKEIPDDLPLQEIFVQEGGPMHAENGILLLQNEAFMVVEGEDHYLLFFPTSEQILEARISKNGRNATIYCKPEIVGEGVKEISYVIRICFLFFSQLQHKVVIHSSSILYREKLWLFSAPSGTGKSTHAGLWQKLFQTPVINGDLNLISIVQDLPVVQGIPWCGTSGIYDIHTYLLGGIIFLKQGEYNHVTSLSKEEKQLRLLHRCISPSWKEEMQERNLSVIEAIDEKVLICHLTCNEEADAVHCIKQIIDDYLEKTISV